MVAATASAIATASKLCCSRSDKRWQRPSKKAMGSTKLAMHIPARFSPETTPKSSFFIRARDPQRDNQDEDELTTNTRAFTSKEDLDYLWKLAAGSILGAAIIKYGSVIFPEITRPNLTEALFIVFSPVLIAVLLLINQSRKEEPS
ncbi:homoserine O-acetyltransferase [Trema orientale]|uniref:Homoserine O-acetyltransferase n=1 Tax=Trema orientale TaxID=63057 RepID=A0A2P5EX12_TREOI|nr:homoserine O-acetyltransferase [Trema orientale]